MFRWRRPIVRGVMVRVFAGSINYRRSLDGIISSLVLSFLLMCGAAVWLTFNVADVLTDRLGGDGSAVRGEYNLPIARWDNIVADAVVPTAEWRRRGV